MRAQYMRGVCQDAPLVTRQVAASCALARRHCAEQLVAHGVGPPTAVSVEGRPWRDLAAELGVLGEAAGRRDNEQLKVHMHMHALCIYVHAMFYMCMLCACYCAYMHRDNEQLKVSYT